MAKTTLPTNYVDDVLNGAMDGKRRYREIPNADGTISLEDATTYDQIGSNFGAAQLNLMSDNINQSFDSGKMLKTMEEVNAVTQEGYGVDALVVKQVNDSLGGLQFGIDENGNYGYIKAGADTVTPFKSDIDLENITIGTSPISVTSGKKYLVTVTQVSRYEPTFSFSGCTVIAKTSLVQNSATGVRYGFTFMAMVEATTNSISITSDPKTTDTSAYSDIKTICVDV